MREFPAYVKWVRTTAKEDRSSADLLRFANWLNMQEASEPTGVPRAEAAPKNRETSNSEDPRTEQDRTKSNSPVNRRRMPAPTTNRAKSRASTSVLSEREELQKQLDEAKQLLSEFQEKEKPRKKRANPRAR